MTTTRDELHARIDHLPDEQLDHAATLLDALADAAEPLPPGHAATTDDVAKWTISEVSIPLRGVLS